ncbi:serine/arginine repetitive matrix protein 1-like [Macrobrachium nipponense]|uniref:serine/arginine repetitive matrix protein 1-like n=1 Tax=Macrobrachium nipponense TaxID=159736 RepID=UPI0030C8728C
MCRPLKRTWKAPFSPLASSPEDFPEETSLEVKRPRRSCDRPSSPAPRSAAASEEDPVDSPTRVLAGLQAQISSLADSLASRSRRRKDISLPVKRSRRFSSKDRSPRRLRSPSYVEVSAERRSSASGITHLAAQHPETFEKGRPDFREQAASLDGDGFSPYRIPASGKRSSPTHPSSSSVRPREERRSGQSRLLSSSPSRRSSPQHLREPRRRPSTSRRSSPGYHPPRVSDPVPSRRFSPVSCSSPIRRQESSRSPAPGRHPSHGSRSPVERRQDPRVLHSPGRRSSFLRRPTPDRSLLSRRQDPLKRPASDRRSAPSSCSPLGRRQDPFKRPAPDRGSVPGSRSPRDRRQDSCRRSPSRKRPVDQGGLSWDRSPASPAVKISSSTKRESDFRHAALLWI